MFCGLQIKIRGAGSVVLFGALGGYATWSIRQSTSP